jgi:hypothetical protein
MGSVTEGVSRLGLGDPRSATALSQPRDEPVPPVRPQRSAEQTQAAAATQAQAALAARRHAEDLDAQARELARFILASAYRTLSCSSAASGSLARPRTTDGMALQASAAIINQPSQTGPNPSGLTIQWAGARNG